jgi:hypothetical protein
VRAAGDRATLALEAHESTLAERNIKECLDAAGE